MRPPQKFAVFGHFARCFHRIRRINGREHPQKHARDPGQFGVIKAFVRMREMLASHQELAGKLAALEEKYDIQFLEVFEAIELLAEVREIKHHRKMGFVKDPQVDGEQPA